MSYAILLCGLLLPYAVSAHDGRPIHVQLFEDETEVWQLWVRTPSSVNPAQVPSVSLSGGCYLTDDARNHYHCPGDATMLLVFDTRHSASPRAIMVATTHLDGTTYHRRIAPGTTTVELRTTRTGVWYSYLLLGLTHIAGGYDHLLFVACLLFLAGSLRRLFLAITGFTIAHSVSLGISALDRISLPSPPLEACIALSVLLLAIELLRNQRQTLTWRYPIWVATVFGLLHGLGFASALNEAGLPHGQALGALLAFNLGVEAGQLLAVGIMLSLFLGAARTLNWQDVLQQTGPRTFVGYAAGIAAAFWLIQRISGFI